MKFRSPFRRALATAAVAAVIATAVPYASAQAAPAPTSVADTYYEVLLNHTRWAELQWDATAGYYRFADFRFAVVLGNAVLITRNDAYDPAATGVSLTSLTDHTIRTIKHYAASNRLAGGTQWGKTLFWDSTYESYLVLAAHLMWDQLDQTTRNNVDLISGGQAAYATSLGTTTDPLSGSWTSNGLTGGYLGDTKLEEMGVYAQSIAPGLAWNSDDPGSDAWGDALGLWMRNETGIRSADLANPAEIDGVAVSDNKSQNVYDTFIGENHGSFGPHYQSEVWRTAGRNSIHFLMAGKELPEVLLAQPNHEELLATILRTMSDSGEPLMPMVDDREFLYGRDVIPLAYLAQVQGNIYAARAEANLADRLLAYQAYGEAPRLAKFSGEPKYEPEARSEIAISYLMHEWRESSGLGTVVPVSNPVLFEYASGAVDYGATAPGMIAQQSPNAWAATIDRAGFTKFAWQPEHDDWLLDVSGGTPSFLPSTSSTVKTRYGHAYTDGADGFDGTASLLALDEGHAGMTTLPTGSVVYATSGTASSEGVLSVRNFTMPGIRGLDGTRTYATTEGTTDYTADPETAVITPPTKPTGVSRLDDVTFTPTTARYVKIQGAQAASNGFGYSLFETEIRTTGDAANLAQAGTATASSEDVANSRQASKTIDGSFTSRWAVTTPERGRADSWIQYDLGSTQSVGNVRLFWETAAARAFSVLVSTNGTTWTEVAFRAPEAARIDDVAFGSTQARYVRMQGVDPATTGFGYSAFEFEIRNGQLGANLALGKTTTASSAAYAPSMATDGSWGSRWAVTTADRPRKDSWLQVDLGSATTVDRVRLGWEVAAAQAYTVQVSLDGTTWTTVSAQAPGVFRAETLDFASTNARYVRMQGTLGNAGYGYSVYEFEVRNGTSGANLSLAGTASASSEDSAGSRQATKVNDGSYSSRWSVATSERQRGDSWLQLDLGASRQFDNVRLNWESAAGSIYRIQVSDDGSTWSDVADYGLDGDFVYSDGDWLTIDDRVGLVVRGSENPITVLPGSKVDKVVLSMGAAAGAAGMVVEGYPLTGATETKNLAIRAEVATDKPALRASDADGYLSLFNLSDARLEGTVTVPQTDDSVAVFQGVQRITDDSTVVDVELGAASAALLPPRFTLVDSDGSRPSTGTAATVVNGTTLRIAAPASTTTELTITQASTGTTKTVSVSAGEVANVAFDSGRPYPVLDHAVDRTTYPTSPLPAGMTDPDLATDDNSCTVWRAGSSNGRMVIDLGAQSDVENVGLLWTEGEVPAATIETSTDGLSYTSQGAAKSGRLSTTTLGANARFVAIRLSGWDAADSADLASFTVFDGSTTKAQIAEQLRPCAGADGAITLETRVWDGTAGAWVAVDGSTTQSRAAESELRLQLTATNTGAVDLSTVGFAVGDDNVTTCAPASLATGAHLECEITLTVEEGRELIESSVSATDPWDRASTGSAAIDLFGWKNDVELSLSVRNPKKGTWVSPTATPGLGIPYDYEGDLDYRYTVFNNGNQDLTALEVTDRELGTAVCATTGIAAGGTTVCTLSAPLTTKSYSSTADASALDPAALEVTALSAAIHLHRLGKPAAPKPPTTAPGSITPSYPVVNTSPTSGDEGDGDGEPVDDGEATPEPSMSPTPTPGDNGSNDGPDVVAPESGSGDGAPVLPWAITAAVLLLLLTGAGFFIFRRRLTD
jgi:hypothetical protein